jgi:peptidoglycan/LPS O-acetylase OafA/YrhL
MTVPVPIPQGEPGAPVPPVPPDHAETWRRAFSLRRNLHALLVPRPGHLRPLDGLRALSILWVVLFHAGFYSVTFVPESRYFEMLLSRWMLPIWRGDFGVDVFFVLSGFLIAGMLADERSRTGRLRLGLFYVRRLLRLWPALLVAALVDATLLDDHADMLWANLLYVSNFVPLAEAAMPWTWSLAIEEQFYLVCPWLVAALAPMRSRTRIAVIAAVALLLCGVAAGVVLAGGFHASDAEIVINRDPARWLAGFDHLYNKPWMRAGPLLAGVGAAYVFRSPKAMDVLGRGGVAAFALPLALATAAACTHWQVVDGATRAIDVAYAACFRLAFGVSVAYVMLLALSQHSVGRTLGRWLSSRALHPIAQLAYSAYLLNPIVTVRVHGALAPAVAASTASPMAFFLPCDLLLTFVAAAVLHLAVERPFMELRPRGESSGSGPEGRSGYAGRTQ